MMIRTFKILIILLPLAAVGCSKVTIIARDDRPDSSTAYNGPVKIMRARGATYEQPAVPAAGSMPYAFEIYSVINDPDEILNAFALETETSSSVEGSSQVIGKVGAQFRNHASVKQLTVQLDDISAMHMAACKAAVIGLNANPSNAENRYQFWQTLQASNRESFRARLQQISSNPKAGSAVSISSSILKPDGVFSDVSHQQRTSVLMQRDPKYANPKLDLEKISQLWDGDDYYCWIKYPLSAGIIPENEAYRLALGRAETIITLFPDWNLGYFSLAVLTQVYAPAKAQTAIDGGSKLDFCVSNYTKAISKTLESGCIDVWFANACNNLAYLIATEMDSRTADYEKAYKLAALSVQFDHEHYGYHETKLQVLKKLIESQRGDVIKRLFPDLETLRKEYAATYEMCDQLHPLRDKEDAQAKADYQKWQVLNRPAGEPATQSPK